MSGLKRIQTLIGVSYLTTLKSMADISGNNTLTTSHPIGTPPEGVCVRVGGLMEMLNANNAIPLLYTPGQLKMLAGKDLHY